MEMIKGPYHRACEDRHQEIGLFNRRKKFKGDLIKFTIKIKDTPCG